MQESLVNKKYSYCGSLFYHKIGKATGVQLKQNHYLAGNYKTQIFLKGKKNNHHHDHVNRITSKSPRKIAFPRFLSQVYAKDRYFSLPVKENVIVKNVLNQKLLTFNCYVDITLIFGGFLCDDTRPMLRRCSFNHSRVPYKTLK